MQVSPHTSETDEALVAYVQQGDRNAFGVLVERYEARLMRYGRKFLSRHEDVEDLVQDAFVSAYQNIQSFDTSARFSPWMYRIAHNAFVNFLRKQQRMPLLIDFDTMVSHPVYDDPAESEREQEEMRRALEKGLSALAPKYREVLVLHYLEDMAYKDIAQVLQVPVGTVGIRIKRAKDSLKKMYGTA